MARKHPEDVLQRFDNYISNIVNLRLKAWSSPTYYLHKVVSKLLEMGAVRVAPFSNRLAHGVPPNIQSLRCFANFEALRFSEPIRSLAEVMVHRMVEKSSKNGGKYASFHLRFEKVAGGLSQPRGEAGKQYADIDSPGQVWRSRKR